MMDSFEVSKDEIQVAKKGSNMDVLENVPVPNVVCRGLNGKISIQMCQMKTSGNEEAKNSTQATYQVRIVKRKDTKDTSDCNNCDKPKFEGAPMRKKAPSTVRGDMKRQFLSQHSRFKVGGHVEAYDPFNARFDTAKNKPIQVKYEECAPEAFPVEKLKDPLLVLSNLKRRYAAQLHEIKSAGDMATYDAYKDRFKLTDDLQAKIDLYRKENGLESDDEEMDMGTN